VCNSLLSGKITGKLNSLLGLSSRLALKIQQCGVVYRKIHLTVDSSAEGIAVQKYCIANKVVYHLLPLPGIGQNEKPNLLASTNEIPGVNSKTNELQMILP
jgi:hypothetical protein